MQSCFGFLRHGVAFFYLPNLLEAPAPFIHFGVLYFNSSGEHLTKTNLVTLEMDMKNEIHGFFVILFFYSGRGCIGRTAIDSKWSQGRRSNGGLLVVLGCVEGCCLRPVCDVVARGGEGEG
ncbi:hypothetical protein F4861DRAFT_26819 [Xylaria intraflava]|nr:hypothetical protein F4861DRAFT_26819 [Xylaria intraflava]